MANNIPSQTRTVDPYSSYDSNIVNQLTRMITREVDCIDHIHSIDVTQDPIEQLHHFYVSTGQCYKDDVIIQITETFRVDMEDPDFYTTFAGEGIVNPFNETGYYHVLLYYEYVKAKPAPQAKIYIIKPSQRVKYDPTKYIFLKAVKVGFLPPSTFYIEPDGFYNNDPEAGYEAYKRIYSQVYCGTEDTLPTYLHARDQGRIIYVVDEDNIYFGGATEWIPLDALKVNLDVTDCTVNQLVYIGLDGNAHPALADDPLTFADGVCVSSADPITGIGQVKIYGYVDEVPIQSDIIDMAAGQKLYLSAAEEGCVTNVESAPYSQFVGKCIAVAGTNTTCSMLFTPGNTASTGGGAGVDFEIIAYQQMLAESVFMLLFIDTFNNQTFIDAASTITYDITNRRVNGDTGDVLISTTLNSDELEQEVFMSRAQVSANTSDDNAVTWYLSNDDGVHWEQTTVNTVHTFATVAIPFILGAGSFTIGEWVQSSINGKRGIVCEQTASELLLSHVTGSLPWEIGEVITGNDSGATCVISATPIDRTTLDYIYLRAKAEFTSDDQYIEDYCVLYSIDTEKDETSVENEMNINTLYGDIYEVPSQNNDGLRLYPFADATSVTFLNIVHDTDTIVRAIVRLDHAAGIGEWSDSDSTPSVSDRFGTYLITDSTASYDITYINDAFDGQEVDIVNGVSDTVSVKNGAWMHLAGGSDCNLGQYDTICLKYINLATGWVEKSRSNN